jgi:RHS repeat-associated protein
MKKRGLAIFLIFSIILSFFPTNFGQSLAKSNSKAHVREKVEILVKYKDSSKSDTIRNKVKTKLNATKLDVKQRFKQAKIDVLEVDADDDLNKTIAELSKDPGVVFAQPNYKITAQSVPNDALFSEQWGLANSGSQGGISGVDIHALSAWETTIGTASTVVGVLDTGIDISHPDLKNNIFVNTGEIPGNNIDDDGNGYVDDVNGWDFANKTNQIFKSIADDTHGTHVAGIIAASANSIGVRGVAPGVKLLPLKFISGGIGYTSDAIEAIDYAKQFGVNIINASFGGPDNNPALKEAISASAILFVASAGNNGQNVDASPVYPADYDLPNVLSVAAVNNQGRLASFSNYGTSVDIVAPGEGILSTLPNNGYGVQSGTSMAAAFISGIAALIHSQFPDLDAVHIASRIQSTASNSPDLAGKASAGIAKADAALVAQTGSATSDSGSVQPAPIDTSGGKGSAVTTLALTVSTQLLEQIHYGEEGVNIATGNYGKTVTDLSVTSPGFIVNIARSYNSKDDRTISTMGRGWTFGFEGSVKDDTTNPTTLKVAKLPNGAAQVFAKNGDGSYTANDSRSTLVKNATDGTHILTTKDQYSYGFNVSGYLVWMKDRNGNQVTIQVDASGKVQSITDTVGRTYNIAYNAAGYIITVTDPLGRIVRYDYDTSNRLSKVTDPRNQVMALYEYDTQGYLTSIKDSAQNVMETIIYDHTAGANQHKVTRYNNPFGNVENFTYDNANRKTTIKDVNNRTTIKWYDTALFATKSQDPEGLTAQVDYNLDTNGYNKFGEEKTITDRSGNITQYVRDANGNITKLINPDSSSKDSAYDSKNNQISEKDELGNMTYYIYDANKINLLKKVQPLNGTDVYSDSTDQSKYAITTYAYFTAAEGYNVKGLLKSETDPEGSTTAYTYDGYGNRKTVTDPNGNVTTFTTNNIGWVTGTVSPEGYHTDYVYDKSGNRVKTVLDKGETNLVVIDSFGRNVQEVSPNQYSALQDGLNDASPTNTYRDSGAGFRYTYMPFGKVKQQTDPLGNVTIFTYDVYGNTLTETKPNLSVYLYEYDVMNRLKKVSFKKNATSLPEVLKTYAYAIVSGKTQKIETKNLNATDTAISVWFSDFRGNIVEEDHPDGGSVLINYNANGTLGSKTDANGNTTSYKYDGLNRISETWAPLTGSTYRYTSVIYDKAGHKLADRTGKDPVTLFSVPVVDRLIATNYTYFPAGQMKSVTTTAGAKTLYAYDKEGNVTREEVYTSAVSSNVTEITSNQLGKRISEKRHVRAGDLSGKDPDSDADTILETQYQYDKNGNLTLVTMPNEDTASTTYDLLNHPIGTGRSGIDENGLPVVITTATSYAWNGQPLTVTDGNGNTTTNTYNEKGLLVKVTDALGGVTAYDYDRADRKVAVVSPQNYDATKLIYDVSRTEYTYNSMDRIKLITEKFTEKTFNPTTFVWSDTWTEAVSKAYNYDLNGNVIKELDGEGYKFGVGSSVDARIASGYGTTHTYNGMNFPVSVLDPVGGQRSLSFTHLYVYDGAGRLISDTDASGAVHRNVYDDAGKVIQESVAKKSTSPDQVVKTAKYDLAGQVLSETDANDNTTSYVYNALGSVRSVTLPGDSTIPKNVITRQYDKIGRFTNQQDLMGHVDLYAYDPDGRELSHTEQGKNGKESLTTRKMFDKVGNMRFETDRNGSTQEHIYDKLGRLVQTNLNVSDLTGTKTMHTNKYTYDKNGNKTKETDWLDNSTAFVYDAKNRLVEKIDPNGISVQKLMYNASDAQIQSYDALNHLTQYGYDRNNRQLFMIDCEGHRSSQTYDNMGNTDTKTDGNGSTTRYVYEYAGRLIAVTNALGETTGYTYDMLGNKLSQTDGKGNVTSYEYNARNKLMRKIDQGGRNGSAGSYTFVQAKVESYAYTSDGLLQSKTDRNGNITSYEYDIHGRTITQTVTGISLTSPLTERRIAYTYDGNGNQLSMTDATGTTRRMYDELNRVIMKSVPSFGTSTFLLDQTVGLAAGFYEEITSDAKGNKTNRVYDKTNRLVIVKDGGQWTSYTYLANGNKQSVKYPNGTQETYSYFKNDQLKTLENYQDTALLDSYNYIYDNAGNQISKSEVVGGIDKGTTNFTYDVLNRLKTVQEPGGKQTSYTYDKAGNRLSERVTLSGVTTETKYEYNEQNRLLTTSKKISTGSTEIVRYSYDNNGNLIRQGKEQTKKVDPQHPIEPDFGMFIYGQENNNPRIANILAGNLVNEYDGWNQLRKTTTADKTVEYTYNGDGQRVVKTTNGQITRFLYEYDKVVLESDGKGRQTARNVYGTSLISRLDAGEKVFYLYNGHADVTSLIDPSGRKRATYDYDAFGNPIDSATQYFDASGNVTTSTGKIDSPYRYAGYQYDKETGLYYLNARYYDASVARFITEDTYAGQDIDPLSLNLYTYVQNNPIMYTDPTGHDLANLKDMVAAAGGTVTWDARAGVATVNVNGKVIPIDNHASGITNVNGRLVIDSTAFDNMFSQGSSTLVTNVTTNQVTVTYKTVMGPSTKTVTNDYKPNITTTYKPVNGPNVEIEPTKSTNNVSGNSSSLNDILVGKWYNVPSTDLKVLKYFMNDILKKGSIDLTGPDVPDELIIAMQAGGGVSVVNGEWNSNTLNGLQAIRAANGISVYGPDQNKLNLNDINALIKKTEDLVSCYQETWCRKINEIGATIAPEVERAAYYIVGGSAIGGGGKPGAGNYGMGNNTTLFRGERSSVTPEVVFEKGFVPKGTHYDLGQHVTSNSTAGNFISTTSDKGIATQFAGKNGYVYEIETSNYIEVNKTLGAKSPFPEQLEFSVPGSVQPYEIKGAYVLKNGVLTGEYIPNHGFKGVK